jgi:hypothetical protein
MDELIILGIYVIDRIKESGRTQKLLSENAAIIRTRLGFHEVSETKCSRNGMIIIELKGTIDINQALINKLNDIGGIIVKQMVFNIN